MQLCPQDQIETLNIKDLYRQHDLLCYLRGDGWQKSEHFVFHYPYLYLYAFHMLIMTEIEKRGYSVCPLWKDSCFRGIHRGYEVSLTTYDDIDIPTPIYQECGNQKKI